MERRLEGMCAGQGLKESSWKWRTRKHLGTRKVTVIDRESVVMLLRV